MGQLIKFGDTIQKEGIEKFDCAQGAVVKAFFVNYGSPYARNMAFCEKVNRYVECDKEMVIKYGLNPSPRYYFLVAALQTDMNGNILGDKEVKVTYLSMTNNQYEHFLAASNNIGEWNGFVTLSKVSKKDGKGNDYSYIEAMPASNKAQGFNAISQPLMARLNELATNEKMILIATQLIDKATGLDKEQYEERLAQLKPSNKQDGVTNQGNSLPQGGNAPQGGNTMYVTSQPAPQAIPQSAPINNTADANVQTVEGEIEPVSDLPF